MSDKPYVIDPLEAQLWQDEDLAVQELRAQLLPQTLSQYNELSANQRVLVARHPETEQRMATVRERSEAMSAVRVRYPNIYLPHAHRATVNAQERLVNAVTYLNIVVEREIGKRSTSVADTAAAARLGAVGDLSSSATRPAVEHGRGGATRGQLRDRT
ncbi:hypothetical protein [Micromonospora sp. SH-82]|uniref:hypothetical protein n=1 Tax=Micromonospora sp. SH-82 TaxID=3132938 RepID=UPI003EB787BB